MRHAFAAIGIFFATLTPFGVGATQPEPGACAHNLGGDAPAEARRAKVRPLRIERGPDFTAGGEGWVSAHRTDDGRTLIASLDSNGETRVFDVGANREIASGAPIEPAIYQHSTRGEWITVPGRGSFILLGGLERLQWFGVDPIETQRGQIEFPGAKLVKPLATAWVDGELFAIVQVDNKVFRVRIMPNGGGTGGDPQPLAALLKAAHLRTSAGLEQIATTSARDVEVFRATDGALLYSAELAHGPLATVTWFEDVDGEPVLVISDADHVALHTPLHPERSPQRLRLAGLGNARVHAVRTDNDAVFIFAPGTEGVDIYRYERRELRLFTHLPTAVAIFKAPNGRAHYVWVETRAEGPPRLHVNELSRTPRAPLESFDLQTDERVRQVHAHDLGDGRQITAVKTNRRVIPLLLSAP